MKEVSSVKGLIKPPPTDAISTPPPPPPINTGQLDPPAVPKKKRLLNASQLSQCKMTLSELALMFGVSVSLRGCFCASTKLLFSTHYEQHSTVQYFGL
eukprot:scaffold4702_cov263-Ochromonas_danica.AAC.1